MRPIDADLLSESFSGTYNFLKSFRETLNDEMDKEIIGSKLCVWLEALSRIKNAPTLDVAPVVHGRWDDSLDGITPYCTECGRTHKCFNRTPNYCPNCGAKMDADKDETNKKGAKT